MLDSNLGLRSVFGVYALESYVLSKVYFESPKFQGAIQPWWYINTSWLAPYLKLGWRRL